VPPTAANSALRSDAVTGSLMAAGGAMLFASKGLFAKALYLRGMDYQTLALLRALLALPLFWGLAAGKGFATPQGTLRQQSPRLLWLAAAAGALCYGLGALVDFHALELIDAGVERSLMFSYPALVVLFTAVARRRWPVVTVGVAVLLTYTGICLVVGGFDVAAWRANAAGALLVLICAFTFAVYFIAGERCTPALGGLGFTVVAMSGATGLIVAQYLAFHSLATVTQVDAIGWLLLGALAVLCMVVPSLLQAGGIRRIGAVRGAILSTVGPPTTMLLGAVLLQERPDIWQILGTALIILGVFVIGRADYR
jgi:drug/metabolite transporter (DMT)-like permease